MALADQTQPVRRWSWPRLAIGISLGVIFSVLAVASIRLDDVWASIQRTNLALVFAAVGSVLLTTYAKSARWSAMIGGGQRDAVQLLPALVIGQMMNTVGPVGPVRFGEIARSVVGSSAVGRGKAYLLGSVALEKLVDGVCVLLLSLALTPFLSLPGGIFGRGGSFWLTLVVLLLGVVVAAVFHRPLLRLLQWAIGWLPQTIQDKVTHIVEEGVHGLRIASWPNRIAVVGWSVAIWTLGAFTNWLLFAAVDLPLASPVVAAIALLVVTQVGGAVPTVPGRIGVFHALVVFTLGMFGIESGIALGYAVVMHIVVFGTQIVLGLAALWRYGVVRS